MAGIWRKPSGLWRVAMRSSSKADVPLIYRGNPRFREAFIALAHRLAAMAVRTSSTVISKPPQHGPTVSRPKVRLLNHRDQFPTPAPGAGFGALCLSAHARLTFLGGGTWNGAPFGARIPESGAKGVEVKHKRVILS